jgi:hypothetical protein
MFVHSCLDDLFEWKLKRSSGLKYFKRTDWTRFSHFIRSIWGFVTRWIVFVTFLDLVLCVTLDFCVFFLSFLFTNPALYTVCEYWLYQATMLITKSNRRYQFDWKKFLTTLFSVGYVSQRMLEILLDRKNHIYAANWVAFSRSMRAMHHKML